MKTVIYLLQVAACTGVFYSFYFLLLRKLTFFTLNRAYLLATLLLSFIIPALTITMDTARALPMIQPIMYVQQMHALPAVAVHEVKAIDIAANWQWLTLLKFCYLAIASASILHFFFTLVNFRQRLNSPELMQIGHVKVLKGGGKMGNSSFLNVIFVNDDALDPDELKQIIAHELLHVKLVHSADRIIAKLVQVVLWFNPFAYLYMRSIEENHEFEVDRLATGGDEKGIYAQLLFKLAVSGQSSLFHSFSKVPLKKRITMLFNKPTSNMKKIIYLLTLPMVVISCFAFANLRTGEKLSIVNDLHALGKHPLVLVDGKVWSDDILYKIGGACVDRVSTDNPPVTSELLKKYGDKAKDGVVKIFTKNHEVTYQTAIERENLSKRAMIDKRQFYARLTLRNKDGSLYDNVTVNMPNGGMVSTDIKRNALVVFLVGGRPYPESEIKTVESIVRENNPSSYAVGPVKSNLHRIKADYSRYDTFFDFFIDSNKLKKVGTVKYQQKTNETISHRKADKLSRQRFAQFKTTDEYKQKQLALSRVSGKTLNFTVVGLIDTNTGVIGRITAYKVKNGNFEYLLRSRHGADGDLTNSGLKTGDEIAVKVGFVMFAKGCPVMIEPEQVSKGGKQLFQLKAMAPAAFLYEANRVRFASGSLADIQKYPSGKWKSATVISNNYQIKFNIKPDAPSFGNLKAGDEVCLRFVHELKTGDSVYTVNDWVALSNNEKSYEVKNPDYFYKFYQKI